MSRTPTPAGSRKLVAPHVAELASLDQQQIDNLIMDGDATVVPDLDLMALMDLQ